jgi:hypothetical protein
MRRGAVEGGQRGVGLGERIVLEMLFVVCEERAMEQEGLESAGDVLGDARDLGVVGRRERMERGCDVRGGRDRARTRRRGGSNGRGG